MNDIDFQNIILNFEKIIGSTLDFSQSDTAEVIFNNIVVGIRPLKKDGTITFSSVIADELPDPISEALLLEILNLNAVPEANYGGNAPVIAQDPKTGFIFVYEILTPSALRTQTLFNHFSEFVRYAIELREHIADNTFVKNYTTIDHNAILV